MQFEIHPAEGGYRVRYTDAKNYKVIFWTQVYNDIRDAMRAIALAKLYAETAPIKNYTSTSLPRAS